MASIRRSPRRYPSRVLALATVATALATPRAHAAAYTFDGTFSNGLWNYSFFGVTNWTGNVTPVSAYTTDIYLGPSGSTSNLFSSMNFASFTLNSLNFRTTGSVTLTGNPIGIGGGGSVNTGSGSAKFMSNALTLNANGVSNAAVTFGVVSTLTSTGVISGSGKLVKTGEGTLVLNGANDYSGGTTVSAGRLIAANPNGDYLNNAALEFRTTGDKFFSGPITGTGSFTKSGSGTLILTGNNDYSGGTAVNAGTLYVAKPHGSYVTNSLLIFSPYLTEIQHATPITGTGSFGLTDGTVILNAQSTYAGDTNVEYGVLVNGVDGALPSTTNLLLNGSYYLEGKTQTIRSLTGNGYLNIGNGALTINGPDNTTYSGIVGGLGTLTKTGTGTLSLTGFNQVYGGTIVNGGRLVVANPFFNYTTNAELEFASSSNTGLGDGVSGTGSLIKGGSGTLTLSGNSTYLGSTTINEGTLALGTSDALPSNTSVTVAPGTTLAVGSWNQTIGSIGGTGEVTFDGGSLTLANAGNTSFAGTASGTGTLVKSGAGTLTLTGSTAPETTVRVASGTVKGVAGVFGGTVDTASGATLELDGSKIGLFEGNVTGEGTLLKTGNRAITMANAPANTGGVHVTGGSLLVEAGGAFGGLTIDSGTTFVNLSDDTLTIGGNAIIQGELATLDGSTTRFTGLVTGAGEFTGAGQVQFDGGFSPGNSPASITFQGDLTFGASNVLTMELGGTTLGSGYDHLNVLGETFLGGRLKVVYVGGYSPILGESFDLFDFDLASGTFSSVSLPSLENGLGWDTSMLYTDGSISVQAVPEPTSLAALGLGALALLKRRRK